MAKLATNADAEIKKLAREYQRIQSDKINEQTLLKAKLGRLASEFFGGRLRHGGRVRRHLRSAR